MRRFPARQQKVLELLADGHSHDAIARQLFISDSTVKTHLKRIYETLGAANGPHAVAIGYQLGILGATT